MTMNGLVRKCVFSLALLALALVGLACAFLPYYARHRQLQRTEASLSRQVADREEEYRNLRRQRDSFETDVSFVEHCARELGLVKADEVVYKAADRVGVPVAPPSATRPTGK